MAVYTSLEALQIRQLLTQYNTGSLISYSGIADGIENSNYHIETTTGHYILTIFEHYKCLLIKYRENITFCQSLIDYRPSQVN